MQCSQIVSAAAVGQQLVVTRLGWQFSRANWLLVFAISALGRLGPPAATGGARGDVVGPPNAMVSPTIRRPLDGRLAPIRL